MAADGNLLSTEEDKLNFMLNVRTIPNIVVIDNNIFGNK